MSRHPYTHAADALRQFVMKEDGFGGCAMSRAQSSQVRRYIAETIGVSDEELATKISERYMKEQGILP